MVGSFEGVVSFDGINLVDSGVGDVFVAKLDAFTYGRSLSIRRAGNQALIFWPTNQGGFLLQAAGTLSPQMIWADLKSAPAVVGDQNTVVEDASGGERFYRLRKP